MAKTINETFTKKISGYNFHIQARNYKTHLFSIDGEKEHCLTTEQMRELAEHLIETANKIDADPDFK